jgi:hypothetical protein
MPDEYGHLATREADALFAAAESEAADQPDGGPGVAGVGKLESGSCPDIYVQVSDFQWVSSQGWNHPWPGYPRLFRQFFEASALAHSAGFRFSAVEPGLHLPRRGRLAEDSGLRKRPRLAGGPESDDVRRQLTKRFDAVEMPENLTHHEMEKTSATLLRGSSEVR